MHKKTCNLCVRYDIKSGKDKLLYEDPLCYIVDNGNTYLDIDGKIMFAKKRISVVIKKHKTHPTEREITSVSSALINFMKKDLKLKEGKDYFLKLTMGTYPNHYHIHAYVLPLTSKGRVR